MSVKEYKLYFQYAANEHSATAVTTFVGYGVMAVLAVPIIELFGVNGFLIEWMAAELIQTFFIHRFNLRLLGSVGEISGRPVFKLGLVLAIVAILVRIGLPVLLRKSYLIQGASAVALMLVLSVLSYFLFNVGAVQRELRMNSAPH